MELVLGNLPLAGNFKHNLQLFETKHWLFFSQNSKLICNFLGGRGDAFHNAALEL